MPRARAAKEPEDKTVKKPKTDEEATGDHSRKHKLNLSIRNTIVGEVFVAGSNEAGQLGLGSLEEGNKLRPKKLVFFNDKQVVMVYSGGMHCIALTADGKLYSWGCNDDMALGRAGEETEPLLLDSLSHEFIVDVACGDSISLALTRDGRVYSWGTFRDSRGLFGFSKEQQRQILPSLIPELERIVHIACGTNHAVAISADGKVYTWGVGEQGQLGRKIMSRHTHEASLKPRIMNFKPYKLKSVFTSAYCGSYHTFLVHESGNVYACGLNNYGQLGLGEFEAEQNFDPYLVELPAEGGIKQIAAGEHHSMILDGKGNIFVFGRNDDGQLGIPDTPKVTDPTLLKKFCENPVAQIGCACGGFFSFALTDAAGDNLWMWGFGESGQLANGGENAEEPEMIDLKGRHVLCAAAGGQHSIFLLKPREE